MTTATSKDPLDIAAAAERNAEASTELHRVADRGRVPTERHARSALRPDQPATKIRTIRGPVALALD